MARLAARAARAPWRFCWRSGSRQGLVIMTNMLGQTMCHMGDMLLYVEGRDPDEACRRGSVVPMDSGSEEWTAWMGGQAGGAGRGCVPSVHRMRPS